MAFILALVALAAAYACWHFFWTSPAFSTFLGAEFGTVWGPRMKYFFWASVAFAIWGLLLNEKAPSAISLLFAALTAALWLASPDGEKFLKSLV